MLKKVVIGVAALAIFASFASAESLVRIMPLGADSDAIPYGMTPDGKYVVGNKRSSSTQAFVWDAVNGTRAIAAGTSVPTLAHGVGVRNVGGVDELVVWALAAGVPASFHSKAIPAGGSTFEYRSFAYNPSGSAFNFPSMNALGVPAGDPSAYWAGHSATGTSWNNSLIGTRGMGDPVVINHSTPGISWNHKTAGAAQRIHAMSASGLAVGRRITTGLPTNYQQNMYLQYTYVGGVVSYGGQVLFKALDPNTTAGEAWGVSPDGSIVTGWGPRVFGSTINAEKVSRPYVLLKGAGDTMGKELPSLPDTNEAGSVTGYAYSVSPDNMLVVGMAYRIGLGERAAFWNLKGSTNPADWTIFDLTDWAEVHGILGGFRSLNRVHSIGKAADGTYWLAGEGTWDFDGSRQGFVMNIVPEPATMILLALGAVPMLRRKR